MFVTCVKAKDVPEPEIPGVFLRLGPTTPQAIVARYRANQAGCPTYGQIQRGELTEVQKNGFEWYPLNSGQTEGGPWCEYATGDIERSDFGYIVLALHRHGRPTSMPFNISDRLGVVARAVYLWNRWAAGDVWRISVREDEEASESLSPGCFYGLLEAQAEAERVKAELEYEAWHTTEEEPPEEGSYVIGRTGGLQALFFYFTDPDTGRACWEEQTQADATDLVTVIPQEWRYVRGL